MPLFSNFWLLIGGLLALAIPVVIHLLLKRRPQRLRFSTLRFFREQDESARRNRRLRNLLLLSLRLLLLLLLVLAFAQPYLTGAAGGEAEPRRHRVLVIDRSASMQTGTRWQRVREVLDAELAALGENDRVALVACGDTTEVLSGWVPPPQLAAAVDELAPGLGRARLAEGLIEATGLIASRERNDPATIVLVSDLQAGDCEGLNRVAIAPETELRVEALTGRGWENLAITGLQPAGPGAFDVRVRNLGAENSRLSKVELAVNGTARASTLVRLEPGRETNIVLHAGVLMPGWQAITASLPAGDALALDDARHLAVLVPAPRRVWCLEPDGHANDFEQATFFLRSALSPGGDETPYYLVEAVAAADAFGRLQREAPALVVVPATISAPVGLPGALGRFADQGGAVVLFTGERLEAGQFNGDWRELAPATLTRLEGDPERPEVYWNLALDQPDAVMFAPFLAPEGGDLSRPVFRRRFGLMPDSEARVLAVFGDGQPFVVARERGRGRVLLVNTSADASWTDWPKRRTFVPWVHGLAGVATGQTPWLAGAAGQAREFGEPLLFNAGNTLAGREVRLRGPSGTSLGVVGEQGQVSLLPDAYGVFALLDERDDVREQLAVNFPAREGETAFLPAADVQRSVQRAVAADRGALAGLMNVSQKELWQIVLGTGLVLLLAESLLANRTWA